MTKHIAILRGDGIGPEIVAETVRVLDKLIAQGLDASYEYAPLGGEAYDEYGHPYPEFTQNLCRKADAVLLGAVGSPQYDNLDRPLRPERGLLAIRKDLNLFANLRPAILYPELANASTLKPEIVAGLDILIVRELTGDIYFGEPRGIRVLENGEREGYNTMKYSESEIRRIAHVAFQSAQKRSKKVCSVGKANVLETTELWREIFEEIGKQYPDVELSHMYVDNAAMQLVRAPKQFDVIATGNIFGDILSDEDAYLSALASRLLHDLTRKQERGLLVLDATRLAASEVALARRVVRSALLWVEAEARLEARHINRVLELVSARAGSVTLPMGVDVRVEHGLVFLRARIADSSRIAAWLRVPGTLDIGSGGTLSARLVEVEHGADPVLLARSHALEWEERSVLLDAEACGIDATSGGCLWVDTPHPGDIICPLGMHGQSKKLADLLNEAQRPVAERARTPIVRTDLRGQVVWVAGIRVDGRAKCTPHTRHLLELSLLSV